ncbi:hypothetical protein ACFO4N_13990 [Camelliibacillus cellulosilyticus]|uniref:Uncharacterized protein n=1 Tax=Camelliibacillus cellulosilyticus TaxID=2174486 RepID=A0ABV9GRK9_9BACL
MSDSDERNRRRRGANVINSGNSYVFVEAEAVSNAVAKALANVRNRQLSSDEGDENHGDTHELLIFTSDEEGTVQTELTRDNVLRSGQIGVVFCLSFLVPSPQRRLPDIHLETGQFARLLCGLDSVNVICVRQVDRNPIITERMVPGDFVVITC